MNKLKIGLALSGGGARGIAHIGVFKALQEHGIQADAVAGSSAGAIAGAMYAAGLPIEKMLEFVKDSNVFKMISLGIPSGGFIKPTYIKKRLATYIEKDSFEALKLPLHVAVSNLNTGKLQIVSEGALFDIVMASSSIPLLFQPVQINDCLYVDGGLLNNMPVAPLVKTTDFVIGVDVMPQIEVKDKEIQNLTSIATRCFTLSIQANTRPNVPLCDILIEPKEVQHYGLFQLNKYEELVEIGYKETIAKIEAIKSGIATRTKALI